MKSWICLIAAIVFEVCGTTSMKLSEGFTKPIPSVLIFIFYGFSFTAFTLGLKQIEVSVAYAIWSGLGSALIAMIGLIWFKETMTPLRILSLASIILGVIGLNFCCGGLH